MKEKLEERLAVLKTERQQVIEQLSANLSAYNGAISEVERWIAEAMGAVEGVVKEVIDEVIPTPEAIVEAPIVEPVAVEPVDPTVTTSPMEVAATPAE